MLPVMARDDEAGPSTGSHEVQDAAPTAEWKDEVQDAPTELEVVVSTGPTWRSGMSASAAGALGIAVNTVKIL